MFLAFLQSNSSNGNVSTTLSGALTLLVAKELFLLIQRWKPNGGDRRAVPEYADKQMEVLGEIRDGINKLVLRSDDSVARAAATAAGKS